MLGAPSCMWCAMQGLASVALGRIASLDLLVVCHFMQPWIQLAFRAVNAHFQLMSSFSPTNIPQAFLHRAALNLFLVQSVLKKCEVPG